MKSFDPPAKRKSSASNIWTTQSTRFMHYPRECDSRRSQYLPQTTRFNQAMQHRVDDSNRQPRIVDEPWPTSHSLSGHSPSNAVRASVRVAEHPSTFQPTRLQRAFY
jgi:hypothetical protein